MIPIKSYDFGPHQHEVEKTLNKSIERTLIYLAPQIMNDPSILDLAEFGYSDKEALQEFKNLYASVQADEYFRKTAAQNLILQTLATHIKLTIPDRDKFSERIPADIRDEVIAELSCSLAEVLPISVPHSELVWYVLDVINGVEHWWEAPVNLVVASGDKSSTPERKQQ